MVTISARAFDVLAVLVANAGELVSNEEMMTAVWPGVVIEENNVQVQVSKLRRLIGPASIATISGRGYRLTLPCTPVGTGARERSVADAAPATSSLAIPRAAQLYGRDEELGDLDELLRTRRLLTLAGVSGVGKTALAAVAVRKVQDHFTDGIAWVDLGAASTHGGILPAVCTALGLPAETPFERFAAHTAGRNVLLVLDHADRVTLAAAELAAQLLAYTPMHMLVTTQVRLNLPEESVFRVTTLAVPTGGTPLAAARTFGALAMLEARIAVLDRHFELDEDNIGDAIRLCRKLDGLPLALGLAAARVPALGIRTVLAHLDDGMMLLSGGSVDAPPRHRSLHAAMEWSYDLLGPAEQALYRQLAALPGWFSPADLATPDTSGLRQLDSLATLVDRALVIFDGSRSDGYTLGETGRLFTTAKRRQTGAPGGDRLPAQGRAQE